MEARTDDGENVILLEAACPPIVPHFTVPGNAECKDKEVPLTELIGKNVPEDLTYCSKVARHDIGTKLMAALKKLTWGEADLLQYGWKGDKVDMVKDDVSAAWLWVSGLAARIFHEHLDSFPEWTSLTIARGKGLE